MDFDHDKRMALTKKDKSRKGTIDAGIKALCNLINSKKNYYTTSSCSGRILLLGFSTSKKKHETKFLYCTHDAADTREMIRALHDTDGEVWFRTECFILHVVCRNIGYADVLLGCCRQLGLKRTGIISIAPKLTVEIINHPRIDAPLRTKEEILASDEYVHFLVARGNEMLRKNREMIARLEKKIFSL